MPIIADNDTCGIVSPSTSGKNSKLSSNPSIYESLLLASLVASQLYRFFAFPLAHLCLGSQFSPQRLHLPSLILCFSTLDFSSSRRWSGTYFVSSIFSD